MQGFQRRVVYITLYEGIAIVAASAGLALMTDAGLGHSGMLAVGASVIAVIWNLVFNALFERWESRQAVRGRSVRRRIAHAIGFEAGDGHAHGRWHLVQRPRGGREGAVVDHGQEHFDVVAGEAHRVRSINLIETR